MKDNSQPIVFFDGVCNFCNASVQWIVRKEESPKFLFAPLQGETAKEKLPLIMQTNPPDSVLLYENGKVYAKSTAALRIARQLRWPWRMLVVFTIIPAFIRNVFYDIIAKNRYKWFGKKDSCMLPSAELRNRFLD